LSEQGIAPEQRNEGVITERDRKFADSPLEGDGFELSVPGRDKLCRAAEGARPVEMAGPPSRLAVTLPRRNRAPDRAPDRESAVQVVLFCAASHSIELGPMRVGWVAMYYAV
jgi:hypothetical protein